jgi:hypothetical protein
MGVGYLVLMDVDLLWVLLGVWLTVGRGSLRWVYFAVVLGGRVWLLDGLGWLAGWLVVVF